MMKTFIKFNMHSTYFYLKNSYDPHWTQSTWDLSWVKTKPTSWLSDFCRSRFTGEVWMEFIMVKVQNAFELKYSIERFQLFVGWFMMTHNFFLRESAERNSSIFHKTVFYSNCAFRSTFFFTQMGNHESLESNIVLIRVWFAAWNALHFVPSISCVLSENFIFAMYEI